MVKSDGPAHKERVGGVVLGLGDEAGVRAAAERLGPVIVCEELRGGVEVLCGLVRDPGVGPMVVCGVGGSWAEPLRETARTMLAPLSQAEAERLVRDVAPVARRLDDAGVAAVAQTLVALGDAAAADPRDRRDRRQSPARATVGGDRAGRARGAGGGGDVRSTQRLERSGRLVVRWRTPCETPKEGTA